LFGSGNDAGHKQKQKKKKEKKKRKRKKGWKKETIDIGCAQVIMRALTF